MKKTDYQLQHDVQEELHWQPSIDSAHIGVAAHEGVVTLTGHVRSFAEKEASEKAAKRVRGVKAVADDLEVRIPYSLVRDDTDIATAAVRALKWKTSVPEEKVKVAVSHGWVTLEGEVDWHFQKESTYKAVRDLMGVIGVTNRITVKPSVAPWEVKQKIEAAFQRSARIEAERVRVEADGGEVTLRGAVRNWDEHDEATRAAWSAPGVTKVVNLISVQEEVPTFV